MRLASTEEADPVVANNEGNAGGQAASDPSDADEDTSNLSLLQRLQNAIDNFNASDHVLEILQAVIILILLMVGIKWYFTRRKNKAKKRKRAERSNTVIKNMMERKPTVPKKQYREQSMKLKKKKDKSFIAKVVRRGSIFASKGSASSEESDDGWAISDLQRNYAGIPEDFCPKISDEEIRSNYRRPKTSTSSTLKSVSSDIKITVEDESKNTRVLLDNKLTDSVLSSNITKIVEEPEKEAIAQESAEQSERADSQTGAKNVIINDEDNNNNNTAHEAPEESQLRPEEAEAVSLKSAVSNSTNAESTPLP